MLDVVSARVWQPAFVDAFTLLHVLRGIYTKKYEGSAAATAPYALLLTAPPSTACYIELRIPTGPVTATSSNTCVSLLAHDTIHQLESAPGCTCIRSCGVQGSPNEDRTC